MTAIFNECECELMDRPTVLAAVRFYGAMQYFQDCGQVGAGGGRKRMRSSTGPSHKHS